MEAEQRTSRFTEWRPGGAAWQFGRRRRVAIGELDVSPCHHAKYSDASFSNARKKTQKGHSCFSFIVNVNGTGMHFAD